jgi:hypothetical protein
MVNVPVLLMFNFCGILAANLYNLGRKRHEENLAVLRARKDAAPTAPELEAGVLEPAVAARALLTD